MFYGYLCGKGRFGVSSEQRLSKAEVRSVMVIDKQVLDRLTMQAKESPRLRMAMDLRNSPDDGSQRMLNAMEPGTVMPVHRHRSTSETVVVLRGIIRWDYYNDNGEKTNSFVLDANGDIRCINVDMGQWHSPECLESGTVLLEMKDGPYEPTGPEDILNL